MSCRLDVEVLPDRCRFSLVVTNNLDSEVILQFPTSQQYDFVVKSVWQWSKDKMFTQMLTSLVLAPNEEKVFTEEYTLPVGEYTAQGILTTIPEKIYTEWVEFTVTKAIRPVLKGKVTKILDKFYLLGEDGTAYLIENPEKELEGKSIEVTSCHTEPIPGTIDKRIYIEEYHD